MRAIALAAVIASIGAALTGGGWAEEAFVTNQLSENLTVVDLTSLQPVATIAIGGKPAGITITPDGRFAYVTSPDAKALTVIDAATRRIIGRINTGVPTANCNWGNDGSTLYITANNDLVRVKTLTKGAGW